MIEAILI